MLTEQWLDSMLSAPSRGLIEDMQKIEGDILLLGAGGKIGPNLALMARNAAREAGISKRVIAVSRFTDPAVRSFMKGHDIDIIPVDLLDEGALDSLPDVPNIIYLAGRKFGTDGNESATWAMNASLPTLVARRFRGARIVVYSTGNIYPTVPTHSGGCTEQTAPAPMGEYAMSSLARERVFEYAAREYGTRVLLYRLNYAVDLRYGVLCDLAGRILRDELISVGVPCFNCVWQGYVNDTTLRSLLLADSPARILNVTGPETVSVRYAASALGALLGRKPILEGEEGPSAYLSNAAQCFALFGYPQVSLSQMIDRQAQWLKDGGRVLGKPTHFEEKGGKY